MTSQQMFAEQATEILKTDPNVIGLAAGGSWITNEMDEYSDVDLVLVTKEKVSDSRDKMFRYARSLGNFLSGFTGDHVGEPRLLICLYDSPLLHVDIKFVTAPEFLHRVENPVILFDRDNQLQKIIASSEAMFPHPDFQWIEDRFWTWVHYALTKIGRGEYFEAMDFFGFIRMVVLGPMLHMSHGKLPRGVRKIESAVSPGDLELLKQTVSGHDRKELLHALINCITLYQRLRKKLFDRNVVLQAATEKRVVEYLREIERRSD
jgi:hypothetical protein